MDHDPLFFFASKEIANFSFSWTIRLCLSILTYYMVLLLPAPGYKDYEGNGAEIPSYQRFIGFNVE